MRQVSRADVPDMPDRIVAATGVYFGVPVISRDRRIRASNVVTGLVKSKIEPSKIPDIRERFASIVHG